MHVRDVGRAPANGAAHRPRARRIPRRHRQARGRGGASGRVAHEVLDHLVAVLPEQVGLGRDDGVLPAELAVAVVDLEDA